MYVLYIYHAVRTYLRVVSGILLERPDNSFKLRMEKCLFVIKAKITRILETIHTIVCVYRSIGQPISNKLHHTV
jgi:hypothetical protein